MGLAAGAEVPAHIDSAYYWRTHLRIHIPVITNPGVIFTCGGESVHMAPGEFWVFNSFRRHEVHNRGDQHRVHLVLDTVGGGRLWDLVEAASREMPAPTETIAPGERDIGSLIFEKVNSPKVMSPWEIGLPFRFPARKDEAPSAVEAGVEPAEATEIRVGRSLGLLRRLR